MTTKRNVLIRSLLLISIAIILMAGCRSVKTVQMYGGPIVSSDRLATLVVPWCIDLRSVDGAFAPSTIKDEMRLMLKPGVHTLEARYVVLYPIGGSDTEKIVSDYIPLAFTGEAGKTYTICSKDPKSLEETRRYAAHVSLWIEAGAAGPVKDDAMNTPALPTAASANTNIRTEDAAIAPQAGNPDIQAQLQAIWEKAGEQDRKAFMNKVLQP